VSTTTEEKIKLSRRQLKAIPFLIGSPTYTQGCEKAKINKTTLYKWLKNPEFRTELDRQRGEIVEAAFGMIAQNIEKAVSTLVGLLDTGDDRVKRLTANDIVNHFLKRRELVDLEERIERIEERLETSR
jgi:hypothetical protein